MKRRNFLKIIGLGIVCPTQLLKRGEAVPVLRINLPFLKADYYEDNTSKIPFGFWKIRSEKETKQIRRDNLHIRDSKLNELKFIDNEDFTEWTSEMPCGWKHPCRKENFNFMVFHNGILLK